MTEDERRIGALENALADANKKITMLESRAAVMDKRVIEHLDGMTRDFDNRVVQAINEAKRKGLIVNA